MNANIKTLSFTIPHRPGALNTCLRIFKSAGINLIHIESHPSKTSQWDYDFTVSFILDDTDRLQVVLNELQKGHFKAINLQLMSSTDTPWFPRKMVDLDHFAEKTLEYGSELSADHPGFTDEKYRLRRAEITAIAKKYKTYCCCVLIV